MGRILYGVSPIGLGHATRAVAIASRLRSLGEEVVFVSGRQAVSFLGSYGFETRDVISEPVPNVKHGEMKWALSWYLQYWRGYSKSKLRVEKLIASWRPDFVVGDEEFASVSLAIDEGIDHAMITDELELGFARSRIARTVERKISAWYRNLRNRASLVLIPDFGVDSGNMRFVGPIVRARTKTPDEVIEQFALPASKRIVLLALSGSGIGSHLLEGAIRAARSMPDSVLVVMGNRGAKVTGERVFDLGVVTEGQNLVASADLVISTAGKSTIDEATSFGTPIIAVPIRNHAEQERNASALGYSYEDLSRLEELVRAKTGKREPARHFDGAERVSRIISSFSRT